VRFEGVDAALRIPGTDLRLFGKPVSYTNRRMGVALAEGEDTDQARQRARSAAALVRPGV
jgi:phosphoribosylglycinamide formyltransferase 2